LENSEDLACRSAGKLSRDLLNIGNVADPDGNATCFYCLLGYLQFLDFCMDV
jgi:hypothetical protein